MMATAKQITEDIRWNMEDNSLDRRAGFKVKTSRKGDQFETTIFGVHSDDAMDALAEYFKGYPAATTRVREDNYLVVIQPAN
jgi:hypothetical protein